MQYLNAKDMSSMLKSKCTTGLDFDDSANLGKCETCIAGKITSTTFTSRKIFTETPLDLILTDVYGPMRNESFRRVQYIITFIVGYS